MHLLIFEPRVTGHHLVFVKHLIEDTVGLVDRLSVALPIDADRCEEFSHQLLPLANQAEIRCEIDVAPAVSSIARGRNLLEELDALLQRVRPDHVWLPSGDTLATYGGLARIAWNWRPPRATVCECGLVYSAFHQGAEGWRTRLARTMQRRLVLASPWTRLLTNDFLLRDFVRIRHPAAANRLALLPDPIAAFPSISKSEARRRLDLPDNGRIIGSAGSFASNPRKGVMELVRAFALNPGPKTDRLLLAGRMGPSLTAQVESEFGALLAERRMLLLNRYLSDEELHWSLAAMDVVCVPYQKHTGLSAIAIRAAEAGRPVLATDSGWLGAIVSRFALGWNIQSFTPDLFARDIAHSLDRAEDYALSSAARRLLEYCRPRNYTRIWQARLLERMGRPADQGRLDWDQVLAGA